MRRRRERSRSAIGFYKDRKGRTRPISPRSGRKARLPQAESFEPIGQNYPFPTKDQNAHPRSGQRTDEEIIQARNGALKALKDQQLELATQNRKEMGAHRPLGIMSDLGIAMHVEPKRGKLIAVEGYGSIVWRDSSVPTKEEVATWEARHKKIEDLQHQELKYTG